MTKYWIKFNSDGLLTEAPLTEAKDGYTEVEVPATSVQYLTRYWQAYRYDADRKTLLAPANLPNLDIDALKSLIDQQSQSISQQTDTINKQAATIKDLQTSLGEATQAQVTAQKSFEDKSTEFQNTFGDLTKQVVALQADIDKLTAAK